MKKDRRPGTRLLTGMVIGMVLGIVVAEMLGDDSRRALGWLLARAGGEDAKVRKVEKVIDGDTIVIDGGEHVRYIGVDAPEQGEPLYEEAKEFQQRILAGGRARIETCEAEPRDKYGRTLAFVTAGGTDVGRKLLRYGLARTLFMGPCGRAVAGDYRSAEREAFRAGLGIWSLQDPRRVDHNEAGRYIGCLLSVTGEVTGVHAGPKAFHMNFGKDFRTDFTAVVFRKDITRLLKEGLEPVTGYKGRRVEVTGIVKDYKGPEIVIESADQIVCLPEAGKKGVPDHAERGAD